VMDVNVTGPFLMCQAVGRHMIERGYGKIINIASAAGLSSQASDFVSGQTLSVDGGSTL
jgi:NAD(P)-dependent dehydrogenase (short-subunit alcohol dehydrogenase family)